MSDYIHQLIEQNAELSAKNSELMGILQSVIQNAPTEKPTLLNIKQNLVQAQRFYAVTQAVKIRLEWIYASMSKGNP